ncbi:MAG: exodeoxyribonuclease VII small subunit [Coriobacteriia bacterium]
MSDERYTFEQARIRLEEIATLARKKDTSLEKSLDLLEEGVRLANICTDLVDHTDLSATAVIEKVGESGQEASTDADLSGELESEVPSEEGAPTASSESADETEDGRDSASNDDSMAAAGGEEGAFEGDPDDE